MTLAISDLHDEDAQREDLHPPAHIRDGQARDQQAEIAGAKRVKQRTTSVRP